MIQKSAWFPSRSAIDDCFRYEKSKEDCHNYINVLVSDGKRIFICGTYAYDAKCSWRNLDQLDKEVQSIFGAARCAHNPRANITFLLTSSGQYFLGSTVDFGGTDSTVSRFSSLENNSRLTRTIPYNENFLNKPQFVGSFEDGEFVYFVFREISLEYARFGKRMYSRIARVCKNEATESSSWYAFTKARLSCAVQDNFYYDEVQGMHFDTEERVLYATFTTPENSIAVSSICAYNMSTIEEGFLGRFISHPSSNSNDWVSTDVNLLDQCKPRQDTFPYYFLESEIKPTIAGPLHTAVLERYTHITVTTLAFSSIHLVFVATDAGLIKKLFVLPSHVACVIEIWQPFLDSKVLPIHTMKYLNESLYIGTDKSVVKIAVARCHRYTSEANCLGPYNPLCRWDRNKCEQTTSYKRNRDNFKACPDANAPIDGGWSVWSSKSDCYQIDGIPSNNNSKIDSAYTVCQCQCQSRKCNKPVPRNGGKTCEGSEINVVYCNVHASCGFATKYILNMTRTCKETNGYLCVGLDRQTINTTDMPPCPTQTSLLPTFSEWSECSSNCGNGTRSRAKCDSPPCFQCDLETESCHTEQCKFPPSGSNDSDDGLYRILYLVFCLSLGIMIGLGPSLFNKYQIYKKAHLTQPAQNCESVSVPLNEVK